MAASGLSLAQDQFTCSICLDLLKYPVTIPCGHSYCMSCITGCWDQDDQKGVYSCPLCRQTFTPRPVLGKNTMLAEVVEKLKKIKLLAARPAHCYAGPGDVKCDVCTETKHEAVKFCLVCLNSYCQNHLEQHENLFKGKKHNLMDATGGLQEMICPQHNKLLEIYCHTDQQCICTLCLVDEHKNHDTASASAERTEKPRHLSDIQRKSKQKVQEREKELRKLRKAVESYKRSAQAAVEDSERIFTELICSIERRRSEVTQLIRDQEKDAVSQAKRLLKLLEQEIADLRRRDIELEQLSHTENHIHFLQRFQSLSASPGSTDLPRITISSILSFDDVAKSVSHLREKIEHFCQEEVEEIPDKVRDIVIIPNPEPKTRVHFLQSFCQFTLDPMTVHNYLSLYDGNRAFSNCFEDQQYPDHPDRFENEYQVLCRESVYERAYWEVEWSGKGGVAIAVSYKSISRKGWSDECMFGRNNKSWSLSCSNSRCLFWHNNKKTKLPVVSSSSRIGVYVDHSAGTLSFYSISDTMTLIHRVQTTFTQPLYPGFRATGVISDSHLKLCDLIDP